MHQARSRALVSLRRSSEPNARHIHLRRVRRGIDEEVGFDLDEIDQEEEQSISAPLPAKDLFTLQKLTKARVVFDEERQLRVLLLLVSLSSETGSKVSGDDAAPGEAGNVSPGLFGAHFQVVGDEGLYERVVQINRPARGEVHDLVSRPASGFLEQFVEDALYIVETFAGGEAVVHVDPELVRHDVLGPPAPRHGRREDL